MASNNDLYAAVVRQVNGLTSERDAKDEQIAALVEERDALRALLEMERDAPRVLKSLSVTDGESGVVDSLKADLDDTKRRLTETSDRCEAYERALVRIRDDFADSADDAGYNMGRIAMFCKLVLDVERVGLQEQLTEVADKRTRYEKALRRIYDDYAEVPHYVEYNMGRINILCEHVLEDV